MGATHSASKKVEAIVTTDGTIYYAMFEGTFESNVYPKVPHVGCTTFGTIDDCMRRVLQYASNCESGMLKGVGSSYIKPESYIRQWRKALANPTRLNASYPVRLPFGTGWRDIEPDAEPKVRELMMKYGLSGKNTFCLDEPHACELLRDLMWEARISPWMLLTETCLGNVVTGLGYVIAKKSTPAPIPVEIYKLPDSRYPNSSDCDHMYRFNGKGPLVKGGWAYQMMGNFINDFVIDAEKGSPGCSEQLIAAFRVQLDSAPFMPEIPETPVIPEIPVTPVFVVDELHLLLD